MLTRDSSKLAKDPLKLVTQLYRLVIVLLFYWDLMFDSFFLSCQSCRYAVVYIPSSTAERGLPYR